MKKIYPTLLIFFFCIFFVDKVEAYIVNRPNNKFGIHLAQPDLNDLKKAADLVNSSGGDWGYVTLVIQDNDRDRNKWQEVFDRMRELKLIPIIRLATHPDGAIWPRGKKEDASDWADFLDSLNWVVKDRYIILFNEPNHAPEWGGRVEPKNYAEVALEYAKKLKEKNEDFFLMLAGLDASAPQWMPKFADEEYFLREVFKNISLAEFNKLFSGWVSHSYPNPAFSGSPTAHGRGTVRGYQWELEMMREMGVRGELPVFITETGWDSSRLSQEAIAENFNLSYQNIWLLDNQVVAVTPFILNYQGEPFIKFSWVKLGNDGYYEPFYKVQSLAKTQGDPQIIEKGELSHDLPRALVVDSSYRFKVLLKNSGQAIWDKDRGYHLALDGLDKSLYFFSEIKNLKPKQEEKIDLFIKTSGVSGQKKTRLVFLKDKETIIEGQDWKFEIVPFPSLTFRTSLYPKLKTAGRDFELQIFDELEQLVYKKAGLSVKDQIGSIDAVPNVAPGKKYRLVILKPYYLPRQEFLVFKRNQNQVNFKAMYPLDFNRDGKLDWGDLVALIKNPKLFFLLIP